MIKRSVATANDSGRHPQPSQPKKPSSKKSLQRRAREGVPPADLMVKIRVAPSPVSVNDPLAHRVQRITNALVDRGYLLRDKQSGQVSAIVGNEAGSGGGAVLVICKPEGLIRLLLLRVIETYPKASLPVIGKNGAVEASPFGERFSDEALDNVTFKTAVMFFSTLGEKLSESLNEQIDESLLLFKQTFISRIAKDMRALPGLDTLEPRHFKGIGLIGQLDKDIDSLVTRAAGKKSDRLIKTLNGLGLHRKINEIPDRLRFHYNAVKPIWEDARDICAANKNSPWKEFIKIKYPPLRDYDYLVMRLGPSTDIPDAEMELILASNNAAHTHSAVSSIALEHAARLCGARKYQYKTAQLFRVLGVATNNIDSQIVSKPSRSANNSSKQKVSKKGRSTHKK